MTHDPQAVPALIRAITELMPYTVTQEDTLSEMLEHFGHALPQDVRTDAKLLRMVHYTFQHLIIFAIENGALSRDSILEHAGVIMGAEGIRAWEKFFRLHDRCAEVLRINTQKLDYSHFNKD